MPKNKQRSIHIELERPVEIQIGERRVRFLGANLLNRVVMIEYDVEPPVERRSMPFGPYLLVLDVTDDTDGQPYPTMWEDFPWPLIAPARMTTRLDRHPPADATRLHVEVREPVGQGVTAHPRPGPPITVFDMPLPSDHAATWTPSGP